MLLNQSHYIPYLLMVMGMVSLMNQVLVMPTKDKKDDCCKEHPKVRTKFKRSGPVSDEGLATDTELQLRNRGNKWGMTRIVCC